MNKAVSNSTQGCSPYHIKNNPVSRFDCFENKKDVNIMSIESKLDRTNPVSVEVNNAGLAEVQDCKGTPFEKFLRDLSTNEKPAFRALDQSEASVSARI